MTSEERLKTKDESSKSDYKPHTDRNTIYIF